MATKTTKTQKTTVKYRGQRAFLKEYFTKRPGQELFLDDILEDAHAEGYAWSARQLQGAIANAVYQNVLSLETIIRGRSWRYLPEKQNDRRVFEEIGVTKEGRVVIQDNEGTLWLAEQL